MIRARGAIAPLLSLVAALVGIWFANTVLAIPAIDGATQLLTPVQHGLTALFSPIGSTITSFMDYSQSRDEMARLRKAVDELNAEVVRLHEAQIENDRLRAMLDFRQRNPNLQLTAATIIALDPSSPVRAATIDLGSSAGLKEGMVALSPAGNLVGRIVQVRPNSSRVLFIVDSSSSVNAMIQRPDSRALGIVNGLPGDRLIMRYLNQQDDVKPGDIIVTSGLGNSYPRGLYIGKLIEVKKNPFDLFQEARIDPAVKFSRLEMLQIITNFTPASLD